MKLAEGLARAAAAFGLDGGDDDDWEEEPEPRLSLEALEELRAEVERRYARCDRPAPEEGPVPVVTPAPAPAEGEGEGVAAWTAPSAAEPACAPPPKKAPCGISRPPRAISLTPSPAWAGHPDTRGR